MGYHSIYIPQPIIAMYGYSALKCIPPCVPFGGSELCLDEEHLVKQILLRKLQNSHWILLIRVGILDHER